jgi:RNA polymerase sigma-70 factor (ECF subfamily)
MQEEPLEMIWNKMHLRLRGFILSRVPDEADADDLLQEVFLRIHTNLQTVRDLQRLESWIFQITRNTIADYYRARRRSVPLDEAVYENHPAASEPEEPAALEELASTLRDVVEALPEPYRQALLLTEFEGLSQREMAFRLGLSFSGAKSRVQRARQKVMDALLACCHFEFDVRGTVCCYRSRCCCCAGTPPNI